MTLIECPFCNTILEVEPPDKIHAAFSIVTPLPHSYYGDIVKTKHKCSNPNCEKSIIIKWFAPLEYFSRL
jgi:hypothetical protein